LVAGSSPVSRFFNSLISNSLPLHIPDLFQACFNRVAKTEHFCGFPLVALRQVGSPHAMKGRVSFVGERTAGQSLVAVSLAFPRKRREADLTLSGLNGRIIGTYDRIIVLLPLSRNISQDFLSRRESQKIAMASLEVAFPKADLAIDFAQLKRKRPMAGVEYLRLLPKPLRDYGE
jgi:hypothetical protein